MYFSSFCQFWRFSVLGTEIWAVTNLWFFFREAEADLGHRIGYRVHVSLHTRLCAEILAVTFFSFSWFLARFSACERSQNWWISVFWWFPTIPRPKTIAENPESWGKKLKSTISAHKPPINTSSDQIPNPRSAWPSRKKNHNLVTTQTANLKCAKRRLLHRAPDLGFPEIHPSLREDISELKRS